MQVAGNGVSQSPGWGLSSYRAIESAGPDEFAGSGFDDRFLQYQPSVGTTCESWAAGHLGASALGLAQAILESSTFPLAFCLGIHSPTVTQVS